MQPPAGKKAIIIVILVVVGALTGTCAGGKVADNSTLLTEAAFVSCAAAVVALAQG